LFKLQTVFHILGWVICGLGGMLFIPSITDVAYGSNDWKVFAEAATLTGFVGVATILSTYTSGDLKLDFRQAHLVITLGWILVALFGAIPFLGMGIGFTDAVFESMSGITTTGSTVLTSLDSLPPGILLWRGILNWIGGIGIIAIAVLILPFLHVGGMQLFKIESSEHSQDKVASMMKTLLFLTGVYATLTGACTLIYYVLGMSGFDAVIHAMATLSTGGFSTHDASFGYFKDPWLRWVAIFFMISGAIPFLLYVKLALGNARALFTDVQVRGFLSFLALTSLAMAYWLTTQREISAFESLTLTTFNITSVVTTTGFSTDDYTAWGPGAIGVFLVLMFVGGCSGSTTGAIKIYRFQILFTFIRAHIKRLFLPNRVLPLKYNGRPLPNDVPLSVLAFLTVFMVTIALFTVVLALLGLDIVTAYSASVTAITNVGPGIGAIIGPSGNFEALPDVAKWVLTLAMLAGRLEVLVLLVVVDPDFWRT